MALKGYSQPGGENAAAVELEENGWINPLAAGNYNSAGSLTLTIKPESMISILRNGLYQYGCSDWARICKGYFT